MSARRTATLFANGMDAGQENFRKRVGRQLSSFEHVVTPGLEFIASGDRFAGPGIAVGRESRKDLVMLTVLRSILLALFIEEVSSRKEGMNRK